MRRPDLPKDHIANVQVGDKIQTPMGVETVTRCDEFRFCSQHYGNVPYYESGNHKIFKIIK